MSQRLYLLTVGMIFLLFTLGNLLRVILMPPGGAPVWASFIAAIITGFLSYEGFHFARKLPPKGRGAEGANCVTCFGKAGVRES